MPGSRRIPLVYPRGEETAICWFLLSGLFSLFMLGYIALSCIGKVEIPEGADLLLPSGLVVRSPVTFLLTFQTIAAITLAPLCFAVMNFIFTENANRHPLQIIVCVGQLYSLALQSGVILMNHLLSSPTRIAKDFQNDVFQVAVICVVAIMPGILLRRSMKTISKILGAFSSMSETLSNHRRASTPLNVTTSVQRVSTASESYSRAECISQNGAQSISSSPSWGKSFPLAVTTPTPSPRTHRIRVRPRLLILDTDNQQDSSAVAEKITIPMTTIEKPTMESVSIATTISRIDLQSDHANTNGNVNGNVNGNSTSNFQSENEDGSAASPSATDSCSTSATDPSSKSAESSATLDFSTDCLAMPTPAQISSPSPKQAPRPHIPKLATTTSQPDPPSPLKSLKAQEAASQIPPFSPSTKKPPLPLSSLGKAIFNNPGIYDKDGFLVEVPQVADEEGGSDDENLGEIVVDKGRFVEGIKQKKKVGYTGLAKLQEDMWMEK